MNRPILRSLRLSLLFCSINCITITGYAHVSEPEFIRTFASQVTVHPDAHLSVHETITVVSKDINIVHGIERFFPIIYKDRMGNRHAVSFTIKQIRADHAPVDYHLIYQTPFAIARIGNAQTMLSPGEHIYEIDYETDRQIGFFEHADELYWNVTGNLTRFVIEHATAQIILPRGITAQQITAEAYTGQLGAHGTDYNVQVAGQTQKTGPATINFETTKPLMPQEGLTVVVTWPKGIVAPPTWWMNVWHFLQDNLLLLWLLLGLLCTLCWYLMALTRFKKSQRSGTIIPLFEPPQGLTPAAVGYLLTYKFDAKSFAAQIVYYAVKGLVTIDFKPGFWSGTYTLNRTDKASSDDPLELFVTEQFFDETNQITLSRANATIIQDAFVTLKSLLKQTIGTQIIWDKRSITIGILLTTIFVVPAFIVDAMKTMFLGSPAIFPVATFIFVIINVIAIKNLRGHTPEGCKLVDQIKGFKMFLETTEVERLKVIGTPPIKTPELFETYLPYAIALGVEKQWTQQFASVFAKLEQQGNPYAPIWVHGIAFNHLHAQDFTNSLSSSLSSAVSTSVPGSSSGSGGRGSSGGGGGGGGVGGW